MTIQRRLLIYGAPVTINTAQLQAWNSTPVEIVPAPGINSIIQPVCFVGQYKAGTRAFGVSDIDSELPSYFCYIDANHATAAEAWFNAGLTTLLQQTADHVQQGGLVTLATQGQQVASGSANADIMNQPMMIKGSSNLVGGAVATVTLNAAGLLYAVNDTGHILKGTNNSATYRVSTVGGGGAVTGVIITAGGHDYGTATGLDTDTSGSGSGLKLNVTVVNKGNGSLITTVFYGIVQLS